jgi:hypothetical protein
MITLSASVGKLGSHRAEDAITVKQLLNSIAIDQGGGGGKLIANGSLQWNDEAVALSIAFSG